MSVSAPLAALILLLSLACPALAQTSVHNLNLLDGLRAPQQERCFAEPDGSLACGNIAIDPTTGNPYSATDPPPLPSGAAADGTDATGVSPLAGAAGIRGWLSALFNGLGQPGATACSSDTASCSINALLQRVAQRLTSLIAANLAVTEAQLETDAGPPGATTCATDTGSCSLNALLQRIAQRITSLIAATLAVTEAQLETDEGPPGATTCATDTGSCSLNALLQRLAQRLTSILTAIGTPMQATGGTITPLVATPTDCGSTIVTGGSAQTAAASDGSRKALIIENPVNATEDLYVAIVGSATTTGVGDFADLGSGGVAQMNIGGVVVQSAVSVIAATTGHRYLCTYMR